MNASGNFNKTQMQVVTLGQLDCGSGKERCWHVSSH